MSLRAPKSRRVRIGITGHNHIDGMGDLSHILNFGQEISKQNPDADVFYQISWGLKQPLEIFPLNPQKVEEDMNRLRGLIDKLIFLKIIPVPKKSFSGRNPKELMAEINRACPEKIHIFSAQTYAQFKFQRKEIFKPADLWVTVSYPPFAMDYGAQGDPQIEQLPMLKDKSMLFWAEHGVADKRDALMESGLPSENIFSMGIGQVTERTKKPVSSVGLFLENNLESNRAKLLSEIENPIFHEFLHGKKRIDSKSATQVIEETEFVPCYFLRDKSESFQFTLNSCLKLFKDSQKKQFLITGSFSVTDIFGDEKSRKLKVGAFIQKLKAEGFTRFEYFDAKTKKIKAITIQEETDKTPKKVIKVLSGCFLSDKDYENAKKLANHCLGCSGDNTLQDAFSNGALPLFAPHFSGKAQVLANLAEILRSHPKAKEWEECIKFLDCYKLEKSDQMNSIFSKIEKVLSPSLIEKWKEICAYVIKEFNVKDQLQEVISNKLAQIKKEHKEYAAAIRARASSVSPLVSPPSPLTSPPSPLSSPPSPLSSPPSPLSSPPSPLSSPPSPLSSPPSPLPSPPSPLSSPPSPLSSPSSLPLDNSSAPKEEPAKEDSDSGVKPK